MEKINCRPEVFEFYTAGELWTDEYTSKQMLGFHLNEEVDIASRNMAFIERSVEWIVRRFKVGAGRKVVDFGCGPGLYTSRLARKKASVMGIDFSGRSIEYAREVAAREGLDIRYVNQNYLDFETDERFDLILMVMCDFCALSPGQRKELLNMFHNILAPGGSILLDVYSLAAFEKREEAAVYEKNLMDGFWSSHAYYGFLNTFKYEREKVVLDKYTIIESAISTPEPVSREAPADRTRTVYNWLGYFSPETLAREFSEGGFTIESYYGDVAGTPFDTEAEEFAIVARTCQEDKAEKGIQD